MFTLYGNTSVDFLIAILIVLSIVVFGAFLRSSFVASVISPGRRSMKGVQRIAVLLLRSFGARFYVTLGIFLVLCFFLQSPHPVFVVVRYAFIFFLLLQVVITLSRIVDFSTKGYFQSLSRGQKAIATTIPSGGVWLKIIFSVLFFAFALPNFGIDVTAFLAALGIGGVIIAFALRYVLSDVFSAFVIFFDQSFSVGDHVVVGKVRGVVERVGVKSTHIRSFGGELVVMPNRDMVNATVFILSDCPVRRVASELSVSCTTDSGVLKDVPGILEKAVSSCDGVTFVHAKVRACTDTAVVFEVVYTLEGVSYDDHVSIRHEVYVAMLDALKRKKVVVGGLSGAGLDETS